MDVARLNFSHGDRADHKRVYDAVRAAADGAGRAVGILADLQGPKIRLGRFAAGPVTGGRARPSGSPSTTSPAPTTGSPPRTSSWPTTRSPATGCWSTTAGSAWPSPRSTAPTCAAVVIEGGVVSDNKGISLPGMNVSVPALSEKDIADLEFALALRVDFIALSFVRSPSDIDLVHEVMDEAGLPAAGDRQAGEAGGGAEPGGGDRRLRRADGRPRRPGRRAALEKVPVVQKRAVRLCREQAKPVIVATQMLDSMIDNPRPTRAEASDVANAVLDGADALMLSGETSVGKYPIESVRDDGPDHRGGRVASRCRGGAAPRRRRTQSGLIATSARDLAEGLDAEALVAFTQSGDTVRRMARLHPRLPLLAFTPVPAVRSQLALSWGAETFLVPRWRRPTRWSALVDEELVDRALPVGDLVVIVAGSPPGTPGSTNLIRVHRIEENLGT